MLTGSKEKINFIALTTNYLFFFSLPSLVSLIFFYSQDCASPEIYIRAMDVIQAPGSDAK